MGRGIPVPWPVEPADLDVADRREAAPALGRPLDGGPKTIALPASSAIGPSRPLGHGSDDSTGRPAGVRRAVGRCELGLRATACRCAWATGTPVPDWCACAPDDGAAKFGTSAPLPPNRLAGYGSTCRTRATGGTPGASVTDEDSDAPAPNADGTTGGIPGPRHEPSNHGSSASRPGPRPAGLIANDRPHPAAHLAAGRRSASIASRRRLGGDQRFSPLERPRGLRTGRGMQNGQDFRTGAGRDEGRSAAPVGGGAGRPGGRDQPGPRGR